MTIESQILMLTLLSVKMENNLALLEKADDDLGPYAMKKRRLQRQVLRPVMTVAALAETSVGGHHPQCPNGGSGPFSGHGRELQGATQDNVHSLGHYLT